MKEFIPLWKMSDEQLLKIFTSIKENYLSPSKWKIYVPEVDEYLNLPEIIDKIERNDAKKYMYKRALQHYIRDIPSKFETIKENLDNIFIRLTFNVQEIVNHSKEQEEYIKELEEENKQLHDKIISLIKDIPQQTKSILREEQKAVEYEPTPKQKKKQSEEDKEDY